MFVSVSPQLDKSRAPPPDHLLNHCITDDFFVQPTQTFGDPSIPFPLPLNLNYPTSIAADLSNLDSLLPPPPALHHRFEAFCPLAVEQGSLCSSGSDSGVSSPLAPSEALTSIDEEDDYLAELTSQMANDMLREQNNDGRFTPGSVPAALSNQDMLRWVDLFTVSPQSTLRLPSGLSYCNKKASVLAVESQHEKPGAEGDSCQDTQPAYEPRLAEISHKIEPTQTMSCHDRNRWSHDLNPGLRSNQTILKDGNWTKEQSSIHPDRAPKQANSVKPKTHAKNNQWRTRRGLVQGEYYVRLSLPKPQKAGQPEAAGSDVKAVFLEDYPNTRTGCTGTGVFLPKTAGNPTEQGRKTRCSTVFIPARVAQSLMVHFSKMNHNQSRSSGGGCFPLQPHSSLRCGAGPNFQQVAQADPEPEPVINCNEMGLPQEWMY